MKIRTLGFGIFVGQSKQFQGLGDVHLRAERVSFLAPGATHMKANARFTHEALNFEQDNDTHLVVSLTAPKIDWQKQRPAVCIVPCIDISGSMNGMKLEYAKQSVLKLIDHLQPGDYCGLMAFESAVHVLYPPQEMTQAKKAELKVMVGNLRTLGGTNFSGGMLESLAHANKMDLPKKVLTRVIMFTDGQANEGVATSREQLLPLLEQNLGRATLSAFGYGEGADQDLLADLAKKGNGNYAFVKNPDDALSAFARELGGLLSSYAQNIKVELVPHAGHKIVEVLSDVDSQEQGDNVVVKLPDILSEEIRHLVFAVRIAKQPNAFPRASSVVDVKLSYECLSSAGRKVEHTEELKGKLKFVKPGEEDKAPIKDVMDLVGTAILVQKQIEAEVLAKQGNYAAAQGVMANAGAFFSALNMHTHATGSMAIGDKMANNAVYACSSGYLNSTKLGGTRGVGGSSYDPEAEALLKNMSVVTSTAAQNGLVSSFVDVGNLPPEQAGPFVQNLKQQWNGNAGVVGAGVVGVSGSAGLGGMVVGGGMGIHAPPPPVHTSAVVVQPLPPPPAPVVSKKTLKKSKSPRW